MKCLCDEDTGLFSVHSTSPNVLGCPSWGTTSESDVQQSSRSESSSLKVHVLPQQCHKSKPPSFQFQERDSSSTQSTGQSYPEIGSAQSGQIFIQHSDSSACSTLNRSGEMSVGGLIRPTMGSPEFGFPHSQLDHNQSFAHIAFHYAGPCYSGLLAAAYGPQSKLMGTAPVRIPLPLDRTDEPIYVNSKQYHAILRRRQYRAKVEAHNKLIRDRKPYIHESRHLHALKRARGAGGRFLSTKKIQESKLTSTKHGQVVSTTSTCSDVTCPSNRDDIFQQQESDFRLYGYPSHIGRDMQDYTADKVVG